MEMHREKTYGHGRGEEGEGSTNEESSMEIYTLPYVKQVVGICCMMQGAKQSTL